MPEVDVLNIKNKTVGKIELPADVFGVSVNKAVLHEVVRNYLANQRQGTAATKTKGLVSGGGKKPWKQKHTGRARAGSIRSPLWRGGGITFGPQPRDYSYRLPKKVKWAGFSSALSAKLADGKVIVVEDLSITEPKTKKLISILTGFGLKDNKVLIIIPDKDNMLELSARNISGVDVRTVNNLNVYDILYHERLFITKKAVELMREVYV
ncbi:MAG: 50S ribosomal protein L4 [Nitrospirae bacterium]|nr:50S ribosomal protein L4 [Nitrospirota bacterium]